MSKHPKKPSPAQEPTRQTSTQWADVAGWYDALVGDEGSEYHREVIIPGIVRMLESDRPSPEIKNQKPKIKNILDLACGQGVLCRKLAALGHRLTGIDAADTLIAAAKRRDEKDALGIHYHVADATRLLDKEKHLTAPLTAESFDAITLVLAIQNITPLSPVWHACRAALKPGGSLVIVMMHPCFRVPKQSDWHWDASKETQSRLIRQYLTSDQIPIQTHPGLAAHGKDATTTTHFHRPLQAYINTLGNAGLLIDHIEEWPSHKTSEGGPRKAALDRARNEIPMFLAIRARKTTS